MPKERSINPAAQQRKADKQKEIAKSRKQQQSQRNEKLARRNPERLQRQIDDLKDLESRGGLRPKDKETLAQLEKDVKGIRRAREVLGDAAPKFPTHERRDDARQEQRDRRQHLGKRRRDADRDAVQSDSDTDPEVRDIAMPRDTPPPFPRDNNPRPSQIGPDGKRQPHALPAKPAAPAAPAQTVYSSAPQLRDLKKEAVRFMPAIVSQQKARVKGQGRLLEPEEMDRLEKAGYSDARKAAEEAGLEARFEQVSSEVRGEGMRGADLDEEARRFEREINDIYHDDIPSNSKAAAIEDVEDDGT